MTRLLCVLALLILVMAGVATAEDAAAPVVGPTTPIAGVGLDGAGMEAWFFDFLGKLLNLFADFIAQIIREVFSGIGGLIGSSGTSHTV
jgi:hypothetical protein